MAEEYTITINGFSITTFSTKKPFQGETNVTINVPLTRMDVVAIGRILDEFQVVPGQEITSHKNFYYILMVLNESGVDYTEYLSGWQDHKQWRQLTDAEYIPLACVLNPTITSFRTATYVLRRSMIDIMQKTLYLLEDSTDVETNIRVYNLFNDVEFIDENIQDEFQKMKAKYHNKFLINPFTELYRDYFKYVKPERISYDATGISRYPAPIKGDPTLVTPDKFNERWAEITCGMFDKSPNTNYMGPFPFDTCVVAGGSLARALNVNFKNANNFDIDIFVLGKDRNDRINNVRKIVRWFDSPNTYFSILGSVVGVYIIGCPRMFQIISNDKTTVYDVITTFDSAHLQWAWADGKIQGTAAAFDAFKHMNTVPTNVGRYKPERFIKAMYDGFSVTLDPSQEDNELFDLSHLVVDPENNQALKNTIADFFRYWYPRDDPTLEGEERDMYIKQEIKLHTPCNVVANSVDEVLKHITVGGNFETDYAATSYKSFNFAHVKVRAATRRSSFDVHDHHGVVRLVTDLMVVDEIKQGQDNFQVICTIAEGGEFEGFLKSIDTVLYRMFILRKPITVTLQKGKVTFNIPTHTIERQTANEVSILKNQHGDPMDITNQLEKGDQVRILFRIHIILNKAWRGPDPGVSLYANRIMKFDKNAADDEDEEAGNNSDISDDEGDSDDDSDDSDNNNTGKDEADDLTSI